MVSNIIARIPNSPSLRGEIARHCEEQSQGMKVITELKCDEAISSINLTKQKLGKNKN